MNMTNLAYVVRDNAVHEWRTITEIAEDEGVSRAELEDVCERTLSGYDMSVVYSYDTRASHA